VTSDRDAVIARAGALARSRFGTGANCAESVLSAVPTALGDESLRLPESIGTGWTAGIGEGGCLCGALAASVMLLGAQTEKQAGAPAARRARSVDAADEMRIAFKDEFGSTCCRVLRKGMTPGTPECREHCAAITGRTAEILTATLIDRGAVAVPLGQRIAGRDIANAALPAVGLAAVAVSGFAAAVVVTGASLSVPVAAAFAGASLVVGLVWTLWRDSRTGSR
jgi:C_GCAxxG_C_C family probable redox protein